MSTDKDKSKDAPGEKDQPAYGVLAPEHMLLGARFVEGAGSPCQAVGAYATEEAPSHMREGALLADLTGSCYELVSGAAAPALVEAACARPRLAVGELGFTACVEGDGSLAALPLVIRTGDTEYVVLDPTTRGDVTQAWLGFLASVEQGGVAPYAEAKLEDASGMLVPLLLMGTAAGHVLADYLGTGAALPEPGRAASLKLDEIGCVVARLPLPKGATAAYLALVPTVSARVLWRSLLSFSEVAPAGQGTLRVALEELLPWGSLTASHEHMHVGRSELAAWGLVRDTDDFVGARGLEP